MKSILSWAWLCIFFGGAAVALAQPTPNGAQPAVNLVAGSERTDSSAPTRFDLDFKGGSIHALIDAISAACHKPVNIYIPQEADSIVIAPFRVSGVSVGDLLLTLSGWSRRGSSAEGYNRSLHYTFFSSLPNSDAAFWSVRIDTPPVEVACRVYSLSPHLDAGLSVDDITTAIRTAWKMLNYTPSTVNLSYHRETKLLIAVAPEQELEAISQVLNALPRGSSGKKAAAPIPTEPLKSPAAKL